MANELIGSAAFTFQKGDLKELAASFIGAARSVTGSTYFHNAPSIGITEEALALGDITAAKAFYLFYNTDDTNYVEIRSATGASNDVIYLPPKFPTIGHFGTDITAPFAIANTAACVIEYWLVQF